MRFGWISFETGEIILIASELLSKSVFAVLLLTANIEEKQIKAPISEYEEEGARIKAA